MHNFQNELQMLGMDNYQVGELIPTDYQSQDWLQFDDARRCGGFGRCGGLVALVVVVDLAVVEALVVVAVLVVLVLVLVLAFLAVLAVLAVLVVLAVLAVLTVGEQLGGSNSSKKFGYFMIGKCPCIRGTSFLVNHNGQIQAHKLIVHN